MPTSAITIIVPSVNGLHDLLPCCDALAAARERLPIDVLMVNRLGPDVSRVVVAKYPWIDVLEMPIETTIPAMRHAAFVRITTPAVAVIEDHVIVPPDWPGRAMAVLAEGFDVAGGPIDNAATGGLLDWATFLCEYASCLPPLPEGDASWLPGNNVVYSRALLERYRAVTAEGRWENRLHDAMRADGVRLERRASLVVGHKKHFGFFEYLSQRFLYSRSYAGARVAETAPLKRVAIGAVAMALPVVIFLRIAKSLLAKGVPKGRLLATMPFIGVFTVSWGIGEVVGYWFGAGDSLRRVR